jgi:hypothetical protein
MSAEALNACRPWWCWLAWLLLDKCTTRPKPGIWRNKVKQAWRKDGVPVSGSYALE